MRQGGATQFTEYCRIKPDEGSGTNWKNPQLNR